MMDDTQQHQQNKRTVLRLVGVGVMMGALAWASVPLYDLFCRVTGFGGTPLVSDTGADTVIDKTIEVRFDASLASDMPWDFRPMERTVDIRLGETGLAFYEAHNPTDRPVAGSASFNVAPYAAGGYFTKIDCFCFEEQVLQPGETVQMPVSFYVDPSILEDEEGKYVPTITLSYTFHVIDLPQDQAALAVPSTGSVN